MLPVFVFSASSKYFYKGLFSSPELIYAIPRTARRGAVAAGLIHRANALSQFIIRIRIFDQLGDHNAVQYAFSHAML